ncbi:hypothetical protein RJ639_016885 [Escallonia herrerae]|uniref:Reverse transcriptase Ty1/copia-type domain-containing protein n=1 Tax=Escallonia herrerae TaxID=1293975 RepID=A0AA88VDQ4_9ASTE|nr:hypothetical protein RJ639_016885 [Escallonia herrerae]
MIALYDLELEQLDVKITFLHCELEEQIFMPQPKGFVILDKEDHVFLLKKSLYGLKQSPMQWYKRFDTFMVEKVTPGMPITVVCLTRVSRMLEGCSTDYRCLVYYRSWVLGATEVVKEAIWLKGFISDLGLKYESSTMSGLGSHNYEKARLACYCAKACEAQPGPFDSTQNTLSAAMNDLYSSNVSTNTA